MLMDVTLATMVQVLQMTDTGFIIPETYKLDHDLSSGDFPFVDHVHQHPDGVFDTTSIICVVAPYTVGEDKDAEGLLCL